MFIIKFVKNILSLVLVLLLCFSNTVTFVVYAQEESPSPETVVTTEIENEAEVTTEVVSESVSGENEVSVVEPTPTLSPESSSKTETVETEETLTPLVSPEPAVEEESSEIVTGDAVSVTEVENNVNSNVVNSVFLNHTLNIFISDDNLNLDLSLLAQNAINKVFENDGNLEDEVSVVALGLNNFAYVENNIDSSADTGGNSIEGDGGGEITTGDAYSVVSVMNNVNTNIVDSTFHVVTINIFGNYQGDIVLPELEGSDQSCDDCADGITISNSAVVSNTVDSSAVSGQNTIMTTDTATGSAKIQTGDSVSVVNVFNLVNENWIGVVFKQIYINTFGAWIGEFLGWGDILASSDKTIEIATSTGGEGGQSCESCIGDVSIQNEAEVVNNISSSANTGGNSIIGSGGNITTGNAYSSITLANFINSNIISSTGFVGFINIFGTLTGNIGGANAFIVPEEVEEKVIQSEPQQEQNQPETGAELVLEASHNVGAYVLPGDTITFTAKVKNPGNATLHDTKVFIELFKSGVSQGGSFFNLGEIKPFKSLTLSTGLVLSKSAEAGDYVAVVTATGNDGDGTKLSDSSDLPFVIIGYTKADNQGVVAGVSASDDTTPPTVLGVTTKGLTDIEKRILAVFSALLLMYLIGRGYQKRELVIDYALRIGSLLT